MLALMCPVRSYTVRFGEIKSYFISCFSLFGTSHFRFQEWELE
ncbi:hypothetical protein LEP1GSC106_2585 [Leptospira interrogans serovar Grippotyphosa str. UI 12764]|nr:hypothetical protein LEP1GSC106_2585 [Leptospira interrogans serovar Grippotyphosa str. UI 12764]